MNTYHYVLYIHLISLFVGIGAGSVLLVCLFQLRAARTLEQAVPWGMVSGKVAKLFPVAIIGLLCDELGGPVYRAATSRVTRPAVLFANSFGSPLPSQRSQRAH